MIAHKTPNQPTIKRPGNHRDSLHSHSPSRCSLRRYGLAILLTCLLAWLLPGQPAQAQSPDAENVEFVSQFGGGVRAVFVQGDYAYISQAGRLTILDITTPAAPTPVGYTAPWGDLIENIYVSGDYTYVAAGDEGLRIVDVSAPTAPTEIGFFDTPGRV